MFTTSNIVFAGLLFSSFCLWSAYIYLALWRIPKEKESRQKLSWYLMIYASSATFCLLLAWGIKEPLARDLLPVFFVLSIIIGYLFRESEISPYKLAEFWSKLGSRHEQEENKDVIDINNSFLHKHKFAISMATSIVIIIVLKLLNVRLPYILTFVLMLVILNICIDIVCRKTM